MKKIIAFLLVCLMALSFCACAENLYYVSVDIEVTENEISDMLLFNKISNQINYEYLSFAFVEPDLSEQYKKVVLPENDEDVKNQIIESKIIVEKCKEFDVFITREETEKAVQTEYDQIKDPSQGEYYNTILSVLEEISITETEYLELVQNESYYIYNKTSLKKYFSDEIFDSSKTTSLDEQFDEYISKLVDYNLR